MLANGDFIFPINYYQTKKMVLTNNLGVQLKAGYLPREEKVWSDAKRWSSSSDYKISNFQGVKGKYFSWSFPFLSLGFHFLQRFRNIKSSFIKTGKIIFSIPQITLNLSKQEFATIFIIIDRSDILL